MGGASGAGGQLGFQPGSQRAVRQVAQRDAAARKVGGVHKVQVAVGAGHVRHLVHGECTAPQGGRRSGGRTGSRPCCRCGSGRCWRWPRGLPARAVHSTRPCTEEESGAEEEAIPDYPVTVFFTREGYLKKIPPQSLRTAGAHKLKEGDEIIHQVETRNNVEALFFTDKQQVYKVRLNELEDGKVAQMGIYLPGRLGMDEGENILAMVITGDYSGYVLFFFAGGKCAKIPLASYATKQNRRKLLKAYSDKELLAKLLFLPEDTELAIRTSAGRMLLVNTAQIAAKTTRDSQGVAVVTLKKNQTIASVVPAETLELANPHRYRVRSLPATGALIRAEDEGEQLSLL